jgi:hypothetical protein
MTHSGHSRPEINRKVGELPHSRSASAVLNFQFEIQGVEVPMSVTHLDSVTLQKSFAALPLATHEAGETLLTAGSKARRLDGANQTLAELKNQIRDGRPRKVIDKTVEKMEGLLSTSGASLIYAGYPYDPYA